MESMSSGSTLESSLAGSPLITVAEVMYPSGDISHAVEASANDLICLMFDVWRVGYDPKDRFCIR